MLWQLLIYIKQAHCKDEIDFHAAKCHSQMVGQLKLPLLHKMKKSFISINSDCGAISEVVFDSEKVPSQCTFC